MLEEEDSFDNSKIPYKYQIVINETLRNDLLITAGYVKSTAELSTIQILSARALQRARNRNVADDHKKRQEEMNRK